MSIYIPVDMYFTPVIRYWKSLKMILKSAWKVLEFDLKKCVRTLHSDVSGTTKQWGQRVDLTSTCQRSQRVWTSPIHRTQRIWYQIDGGAGARSSLTFTCSCVCVCGAETNEEEEDEGLNSTSAKSFITGSKNQNVEFKLSVLRLRDKRRWWAAVWKVHLIINSTSTVCEHLFIHFASLV